MPVNTPEEKDRQFASTLARGLEILLCFRPGESALGNRDLVARTGLDKATVSRLTFTLTALGYLRHDTQLAKYRLGSPVLSLGYPLLASMHVRQIARPLMKELADRVHGTVAMTIRDRLSMVYVEACRPNEDEAPYADIGVSLPLIATAAGQAWLAKQAPAERDRVLKQIKVKDPEMYTRHASKLPHALRDFDTQGFCINQGFLRADRFAVAVPLSRPIDSEMIVLNCSVSAHEVGARQLVSEIGPSLLTMVRSIEVAYGLH